MKKRYVQATVIISALLFMTACAALDEIARTMTNLRRLQFRLQGVGEFSLAGVRLSGRERIGEFSVEDGLRLLNAFRGGSLAASFVLKVEALNPNDGQGGTTRTHSTLTRFDWRLLIDEEPTISGGIDRPIEIPGTGQSTVIPMRLELDLYEFFGNRGYEDLLGLALALGGRRGDVSRLALDARPYVSTPLGEISYPERIRIISKEFR